MLVWSGIRGHKVTDSLRSLVSGQQPSGSTDLPVTASFDPAVRTAAGSSSSSTGATGGTTAGGLTTYDGKQVAAWIAPILSCAKSHGWSGTVNSGYRSYADQVRVCATGVQPCAAPGTSHHQGTAYPNGAVDVSEAAQLSGILASGACNARGLVWAGAKDPVHFSVPSAGGY